MKLKRKAIFLAVASLFAEAALAQSIPVGTLPTLDRVVTGVASPSTSGSTMTVRQESARAFIDWTSFNIGRDAVVHFDHVTGNKAVTANRVSAGTSQTVIEGMLSGAGNVIILNTNGVLFGATARVNVGGLIASTAGDVDSAQFGPSATGAIVIKDAKSGKITNQARPSTLYPTAGITVADTGLVAFLAPQVANSGVITATKGRIVLASAEAATLSLNGNNLYEIAVTKGILAGSVADAGVTNTGTLSATGTDSATGAVGTIVISAVDAANAVSGVINLEGIQQASRIEVHGGTVYLTSDLNATTVTGTSNVVTVSKVTPGGGPTTAGGQIQDGVDIAKSGGTVNVGEGTFAESVAIRKALTLDGAGMDKTIIASGASADGIVVKGNIGADASVTISDLTVQGAKQGIVVADFDKLPSGANVDTVLDKITLQRVAVRNSASSGFISSSGGSTIPTRVKNIKILDSLFAGNGVGNGNGAADINIFRFNGTAEIKNVEILGTSSSNPDTATDYGLQIRGHGDLVNMTAAGVVNLDNVHIAGTYKKAHLAIQSYSDGSKIVMKDVVLGGSYTASTGESVSSSKSNWGAFFASDMRGALSLGNTTFAGGTFGFGDIRIGGGTNSIGDGTTSLRVNATGATFAGAADGFAIEDRVEHALDVSGLGLVTWQTGHLYVTADSGSIQRGIDAACTCGTTVHVGAGTFTEQLTINKSLILLGSGASNTIVKAPNSLVADGGLNSILTISGSGTDAEVSGFTFKGPVLGLDAGIFVRDGARAHIHHNSVLDIRDAVALSGVQRGIGIRVGGAALATPTYGTAMIEDNLIMGYQKGGIVVDGPGSDATIRRNTVIGAGPTQVIAQNGIQASRGASARIEGNTVSGHDYNKPNDDTTATGILIFTTDIHSARGEIIVGPNTVKDNEVGVWTNDPLSLTRIDLSGVADSNAHKAVAEFDAWDAANAVLVNGTKFSGASGALGDIVDVGGVLRVTGWDGFASIEPAFTQVAAGGTVNIAAGTYLLSSTIAVDKGVSFLGPNAGTHGNSGSRVDEAVITGTNPGGPAFRIGTDAQVTFDGLKFEGGLSQPIDSYFAGNNITLRNNVFNNQAAFLFFSSPEHLTIERNRFSNVSDQVSPNFSDTVFVAGNWNGTSGTVVTIQDNLFENPNTVIGGLNLSNVSGVVTGNTFKNLKYYGILLANNSSNLFVTNNLFDHITNPDPGVSATWGAGIRFYTPAFTGPVVITGNEFTNSAIGISVRMGSDISGMNVQVADNSFHGNAQAIRNEGTGTLNASRNWWGTTDATALAAQMTGAVDFSPMLASGTDANPSLAGFQGNRDSLYVTALGAQSGTTGRIQEGVDLANTGGTVNVGSGTYAESVILGDVRNLVFGDVTLGGLTINSGAAWSGIRGSVTANGAAGFVFDAPIYLLGDTSLATTGANIAFNGDIQGFGGAYALSLNAGTGDVMMVSGGSASNPLGRLEVDSNNFTLLSTLWVSGYDINALGTVALSDHTLRSVGGGGTDAIAAGGDVTGSTISDSGVQIDAGGDVAANVTSQGGVDVAANNVTGNFSAPTLSFEAQQSVNVVVNAPGPVEVHSGGPANVAGSAPALVVDAPSGSVSGSFGQVTNAGGGIIEVNGKPQVNPTVAANADNNRVVPAEITTAATNDPTNSAPRPGSLRRRKAEDALDVLDNGEALEIDLTPG